MKNKTKTTEDHKKLLGKEKLLFIEQALKSENYESYLLNETDVISYIVISTEKRIVEFTPLAQKNVQKIFNHQIYIGQSVYDLIEKEYVTDFNKVFDNVVFNNGTFSEKFFQAKSEESNFFMIKFLPLRNEIDEIDRICILAFETTDCMDIITTLQKKELELTKNNENKDLFLKSVSHDLKTPINSIIGFIDLMKSELNTMDRSELEQYVNIIYQSANSASNLINDLLILSSIKNNTSDELKSLINLSELVSNVYNELKHIAHSKDILLKQNIDINIPIITDKNMISILLRNLVNNAIKFSNAGGQVMVCFSIFNNEVLLNVSDMGVGMSENQLLSLFDSPEKSLSTKGTNGEIGTGLGLTICKELVDIMKGKIWVESKISIGTDVFVTFPI